jgi:hypothetical protein
MQLIPLIDSKDGTVPAFAWPDGYPLFYLANDGETLCPKCVNANVRAILESTLEGARDGWAVEAVDVNWEDAEMFCANCNTRIPSAYAEVE